FYLKGQRASRHALRWFIPVMLLLSVTIFWFGRDELIERMSTLSAVAVDPTADARFIVIQDTANLIAKFPIVGCGFGAFRHCFPMFQSYGMERRWLHAHNDWIQLFAEGGLVGGVLFLLVCAAWLAVVSSRYRRASSRAQLIGLGCCFGLTTIALHSVVDYSLHKPANALLLAVLAGMAVATVHIRPGGRSPRPLTDHIKRSQRRLTSALILVFAFGTLVVIKAYLVDYRSELAYTRFLLYKRLVTKAESPRSRDSAARAAFKETGHILPGCRGNPDALTDVVSATRIWIGDAALDRETRIHLAEAGARLAPIAAAVAPSDYLKWLELGRLYFEIGHWDMATAARERVRALARHPESLRLFESDDDDVPESIMMNTLAQPPKNRRR
ncbi:MAG: O-antigen ligase family protein, partial [Verrucomicrobia bacterium]|nr:O-antigen ligase family protein [Verrucomicrobiota bacterium]